MPIKDQLEYYENLWITLFCLLVYAAYENIFQVVEVMMTWDHFLLPIFLFSLVDVYGIYVPIARRKNAFLSAERP